MALQHLQLVACRRIPDPHRSVVRARDNLFAICENATERTLFVWPFNAFNTLPIEASQTRTKLSPEPETICLPSGENATDVTESVWPFNTFNSSPVDASQIRTDLSFEPETIRFPLGETATADTKLCTFRVINSVLPNEALMKPGIFGKWDFQRRQGSKLRGQVASAEM